MLNWIQLSMCHRDRNSLPVLHHYMISYLKWTVSHILCTWSKRNQSTTKVKGNKKKSCWLCCCWMKLWFFPLPALPSLFYIEHLQTLWCILFYKVSHRFTLKTKLSVTISKLAPVRYKLQGLKSKFTTQSLSVGTGELNLNFSGLFFKFHSLNSCIAAQVCLWSKLSHSDQCKTRL